MSFLPGMSGITGGFGAADQQTALLAHFDGADTSTSFIDSSAYPKAMTGAGNAQIDTAQSVFGGASLLLDGTGDYVAVPSLTSLGSGAWTIECRYRPATVTGFRSVFCALASGSGFGAMVAANGATLNLYLSANGTTFGIANGTAGGTVTINTQHTIALVFTGSSYVVYLNGTAVITTVSAVVVAAPALGLFIGSQTSGSSFVSGHIDELRVSIGVARYSGNYTPAVAAF